MLSFAHSGSRISRDLQRDFACRHSQLKIYSCNRLSHYFPAAVAVVAAMAVALVLAVGFSGDGRGREGYRDRS